MSENEQTDVVEGAESQGEAAAGTMTPEAMRAAAAALGRTGRRGDR